jgi:hypothetical protein
MKVKDIALIVLCWSLIIGQFFISKRINRVEENQIAVMDCMIKLSSGVISNADSIVKLAKACDNNAQEISDTVTLVGKLMR